MAELFDTFENAVRKAKLVALCTIIGGPHVGAKLLLWPDGAVEGDLGSATLNREVAQRAQELMREQRSERFSLSAEGQEYDLFVDVQAPPPKLIVVGAVHIAIHLVAFAKQLGFHTMVVDARSAFATDDRFPHVDELITQWPADALSELGIDESTCVVVLTHDEKLDNPALAVAVKSPAQYIGALGSKKTHARRVAALKAEGVTDAQISRIHAPIGIDLGGRKPEEIAVSIIAEIVAVRNGQG
ncbi:MAG: XdhC family protein [Caldilineaceae bacterium]|nr:XdhC family protein [Caldilineaceae bacterium]